MPPSLVVLFHPPRRMQVVVFDLELQQPAASTQLPSNRSPFRSILGCYGHHSVGLGPLEGGIDLMYCYHQATPPSPEYRYLLRLALLSTCCLIATTARCRNAHFGGGGEGTFVRHGDRIRFPFISMGYAQVKERQESCAPYSENSTIV